MHAQELDPMALALSHAVKIAVLKVQERVIDRVTAPTAAGAPLQ